MRSCYTCIAIKICPLPNMNTTVNQIAPPFDQNRIYKLEHNRWPSENRARYDVLRQEVAVLNYVGIRHFCLSDASFLSPRKLEEAGHKKEETTRT